MGLYPHWGHTSDIVTQDHDDTPDEGTSERMARADHRHGMPSAGGSSSSSEAFPVGSVFLSVVATDPATLLGYGTWAAFGAGRMLVGLDSGDTAFDTVEETGGAKTHGHTFTQPGDHAALSHAGTAVGNHAVTQPSAHSNHAVTQPSAHTDVPTHTHAHNMQGGTTAATTGTNVLGSTATGGSVRAMAIATSAPAGAVSSQPHTGTAVDAHSAHTGTAVDAHSVTQPSQHAAQSHAGGAVADGANVPPYIVVHMWKRTG